MNIERKPIVGRVLSGIVYKFFERTGNLGINFIVSIILARMISPDDFGIIALTMVFIAICDVFVTYGFGNSLVVNKNSDSLDFSTCFYFGIFLSLLVYIFLFYFAPVLAKFFNVAMLSDVIRVMGLRIPIAAINSVQIAYVSKYMLFDKLFYSTSLGTIFSGLMSIIMAYSGYGVWALVGQYMSKTFIDTVALFITLKWYPNMRFSITRLKAIYDYGWKILLIGMVDTLYSHLRSIIISKKYTRTDLAFYDRGMKFPGLGMNIFESTIDGVLFPALSNCDDCDRNMIIKRMLVCSTYIIFPIMIGLAMVSEHLVSVLLTDKWLSCVVYLQIGCLALMFRPMLLIDACVVRASGDSYMLLKLDSLQKFIGIVFLMATVKYGVFYIAMSLVITNIVAVITNMYVVSKKIGYTCWMQISDIAGNLTTSILMGVVIYLSGKYIVIQSYGWSLCLQILVGIIAYIILSYFFKLEGFCLFLNLLRSKLNKLSGAV